MMSPSASGFGWDDAKKMIVVEKEVYSQWCKSHPTATGLYGKLFPHFNNLDVVFGKDKAYDHASESPAEHAYNIMKEFFQPTQGSEFEFNLNEGEENYYESQIPETPTYTDTQAPSQVSQSQCEATSKIEGLQAVDVIRAAMLITKDNNLCDCFFTMDTHELRKEFVKIVLSNTSS
ncbi:unnamed protein product [Vicia faba]|uniref:Myb/SANT-like domain-containing protein n=1 Tax=Vicia faba TaxID=3906 RepID=A0AAV1A7W7_VICFA|nr:unnamed protein product [Vicia faba]